jgi:chemotaxis protein CheX
MRHVPREAIVAMIQEATGAVFSTMLSLPCEALPARQESGDPAPVDGVVALVGIAGPWTGTGRLYCAPEFACKLAGALLMTQCTAVDGDVLDAVAEVANMVIGNLKTALEAQLGPLALSVPTVIYGRNYQARTANISDWIVVPFASGPDTLEIRFCLVPTQAASRTPLHRPEMVGA